METLTLNNYFTNTNKEVNNLQIHQTKHYNLFTKLEGNRNINKLHIKRLKNSIQKKHLFTVLIVNEHFNIIDGQHRFEALKELGLPIHYIIIKGYGLKEVQILNANSKNWSADDYLVGYCDLGKKDYIIYKDFKNKYGFGHNECQLLLAGRHIKGSGCEFNTGTFKVINFSKAVKFADQIVSLKDFYNGYKRRSFVYAIITLLNNDNFDINCFNNKLKNQPNALTDCTSVKNYIILIEEIYNYRNRNKVSLRY